MRVKATDLQNAFGKYLALAENEDIIVTKNGVSVAKLSRYREPDFYIVHEEAGEYKAHRKVGYDEYMALVDSSDQRFELIGGEVYLLASPSFKHQIVVGEIAGIFHLFFKGKRCRPVTAPLDIRLFGFATKFEEDPNVVQPDLAVICDPDKVSAEGRYEGVPTLVAEVLSPSTRGKDMAAKLNLYMKSGVGEYWIVDPEGRSIVRYSFSAPRDIQDFRLFTGGESIRSILFDELEIPLAEIFGAI